MIAGKGDPNSIRRLGLVTLVELPQLARSVLAVLLVQGYLEWELLLLVRGKREPLSRDGMIGSGAGYGVGICVRSTICSPTLRSSIFKSEGP